MHFSGEFWYVCTVRDNLCASPCVNVRLQQPKHGSAASPRCLADTPRLRGDFPTRNAACRQLAEPPLKRGALPALRFFVGPSRAGKFQPTDQLTSPPCPLIQHQCTGALLPFLQKTLPMDSLAFRARLRARFFTNRPVLSQFPMSHHPNPMTFSQDGNER